MTSAWNFHAATPDERKTFATLAATRAHPSTPAGPPNANRHVLRLTTPHGVYFLKCFAWTQWKNRLRNRLTAPRCDLDAERERLVAAALEARGHAGPRVVATGREGGASWFLCAELAGRELARAIHEPGVATEAARFLGRVLASGVTLPDLALDHVFVRTDGAAPSFALLDLHNGALRRPRRRDLVRALRRLARSARGLGASRFQALRFAARLLEALGRGVETRAIVLRLPPFDTHGRYDVAGKSRAYALRSPARNAREVQLLRALWPGRTGEHVVDLPCGAGRLRALLEGELGAHWIGADRSFAMLGEAEGPRVHADASAMPFATGSVDGVVVFRFLHHLRPAEAAAVVAEAARVARRFVVLSHFQPFSANALRRALKRVVLGEEATRHALRGRTLDAWLGRHGYRLVATRADGWLHDLRVRAYERVER